MAPSSGYIAKPVAAESGQRGVGAEAAVGDPARRPGRPLRRLLRRSPRARSPRTRRRPGGRPSPRSAQLVAQRAADLGQQAVPSRWPCSSLTALNRRGRAGSARTRGRGAGGGRFRRRGAPRRPVVADPGQLVAAGQLPERFVAGPQAGGSGSGSRAPTRARQAASIAPRIIRLASEKEPSRSARAQAGADRHQRRDQHADADQRPADWQRSAWIATSELSRDSRSWPGFGVGRAGPRLPRARPPAAPTTMRRCATRSKSSAAEERAAARSPLHQPRPARVRPGEPAGDRQGGAFCPLFAVFGDRAPALPGGVRRRGAGRRPPLRRARRASAPRSSTSASSSATATTRSPRSAAPTSPASGSPTCSPSCCSAAGSPPTSSSRPATSPTTSRCRAAATASTATSGSAPSSAAAMDELFAIYSRSLGAVEDWAAARWPRGEGEPEGRLEALDPRQGARPAARPAAGGDAQPRRHLRLRPGLRAADPAAARLAAARGARVRRHDPRRAAAGDAELRLPGRAPRARRRVDLLPAAPPRAHRGAGSPGLGLDRRGDGDGSPSVELLHVDGGEEDLLAACLFEASSASETEILAPDRRPRPRASGRELLAALAGERGNRRHRPGRGFEAVRYRFEIVSDYGAFRDLQRHRMLTCQWQRLGPDLGAGVPEELARGRRRRRVRARRWRSPAQEYERLAAAGLARAGALRAQPRLPDPLHPRPQRPRGDAPDRAALRPRGPSRPTAPSPRRCTSASPPSTRGSPPR